MKGERFNCEIAQRGLSDFWRKPSDLLQASFILLCCRRNCSESCTFCGVRRLGHCRGWDSNSIRFRGPTAIEELSLPTVLH